MSYFPEALFLRFSSLHLSLTLLQVRLPVLWHPTNVGGRGDLSPEPLRGERRRISTIGSCQCDLHASYCYLSLASESYRHPHAGDRR